MKRNIFLPVMLLILSLFARPVNSKITLITPNGGEELRTGKIVSIEWEYNTESGFDKNVIVVLYRNGIKFITISDKTTNSGQYLWEIPLDIPEGTKYRIRIRSKQDLSLNDFSDEDFSILKK